MTRYLHHVLRIPLGLVFLATSLIGLFKLAAPPPDYPAAAMAFSTAMGDTGYFMTMVAIVQIVCAVALLLGWWVPLALVVLAPVTVNILLFHAFLTPGLLLGSAAPGVLVFVLNVWLLWIYRAHFRGLLVRRARP